LWKTKRNGDPWAIAVSEKGDTIESLAQLVGLDPEKWKNWVTVWNNTGEPEFACQCQDLLKAKLRPGQIFRIPNTIVAYWAGELSSFGKWWVAWKADIRYLEDRGFLVLVVNAKGHGPEGISAKEFEDMLKKLSRWRVLHGVFMWGHGFEGEFYVKFADERISYEKLAKGLPYKLGLVLVNACESLKGEKGAHVLASPHAAVGGHQRVMVPWSQELQVAMGTATLLTGLLVPSPLSGKQKVAGTAKIIHSFAVDHLIHPSDILKPGQQGTRR
jgi:hypothetical protein